VVAQATTQVYDPNPPPVDAEPVVEVTEVVEVEAEPAVEVAEVVEEVGVDVAEGGGTLDPDDEIDAGGADEDFDATDAGEGGGSEDGDPGPVDVGDPGGSGDGESADAVSDEDGAHSEVTSSEDADTTSPEDADATSPEDADVTSSEDGDTWQAPEDAHGADAGAVEGDTREDAREDAGGLADAALDSVGGDSGAGVDSAEIAEPGPEDTTQDTGEAETREADTVEADSREMDTRADPEEEVRDAAGEVSDTSMGRDKGCAGASASAWALLGLLGVIGLRRRGRPLG